MWLFHQSSSAARTALIYITVGALIVIWTGVWFVYLRNNPPETTNVYYLIGGLAVTGATFLGIGFGLGRIGRAARHADMPAEVTPSALSVPPASPAASAIPVAPARTVTGPDAHALASTPQAVAPIKRPTDPPRIGTGV
jgi:hypothetical protein